MVSSKWPELYQYIQSHIEVLPGEEQFGALLEERFELLGQQFLETGKKAEKGQIDWLEHEAFILSLSELIQTAELSYAHIRFLFETTMAAQLCQFALTLINTRRALLSDAEYCQWAGLAYQQLGDYELARQMFEYAAIHAPDCGMNHCYLGFAHLHLGNPERARLSFEQSIEAEPGFVGGYQNLAGLCYQDGDFPLAAQYAEKARQTNKTLPATYITAISSYLAMGDPLRADEWVSYAFDNQVSSPELVRLAGITAHKNGRNEEALEALNHYLSMMKDQQQESFDVLYVRAHVKAELGMHSELEDDLRQLLVFEPYDEWSLEQLFLSYIATEQWQNAQLVMVDLNKQAAHYKITYREQMNLINQKLSLDLVEVTK